MFIVTINKRLHNVNDVDVHGYIQPDMFINLINMKCIEQNIKKDSLLRKLLFTPSAARSCGTTVAYTDQLSDCCYHIVR